MSADEGVKRLPHQSAIYFNYLSHYNLPFHGGSRRLRARRLRRCRCISSSSSSVFCHRPVAAPVRYLGELQDQLPGEVAAISSCSIFRFWSPSDKPKKLRFQAVPRQTGLYRSLSWGFSSVLIENFCCCFSREKIAASHHPAPRQMPSLLDFLSSCPPTYFSEDFRIPELLMEGRRK